MARRLTEGGKATLQACLEEATTGIDGHPQLSFLLQDLTTGAEDELLVSCGGGADRDIHRIASMTKAVTSACALLLAEEGKLNLGAPVKNYIPEFASMTIASVLEDGTIGERALPAGAMTVKHLLNHTSGLLYCFADGR